MDLNREQLAAVNHYKGPVILLAGPGSGKTSVIINRINTLINQYNVSPHKILSLSFSKASVTQLSQRYNSSYIKHQDNEFVNFYTFHSLFLRFITRANKNHDAYITNTEDEESIVISAITDTLCIDCVDDVLLKETIKAISYFKNNNSSLDRYKLKVLSEKEFLKIYNIYENAKDVIGTINFDDMLINGLKILKYKKLERQYWQDRYDFILIDEFQDINFTQLEAIKILGAKHKNVFVVGDMNQGIYGFRGAKDESFTDFKKFYKDCKILSLSTNYRSTDEIISLSNKLFKDTINYTGTNKKGQPPSFMLFNSIKEEISMVAERVKKLCEDGLRPCDIAILYRERWTYEQGFVQIFRKASIPFVLNKRTKAQNIIRGYNHTLVTVSAYLKLTMDINDNESFKKVFNNPYRGINKDMTEVYDGDSSIFYGLLHSTALEPWQNHNLIELERNLKTISKLSPRQAVSYIITNIYVPNDDLTATDMLREASKFSTIESYVKYLDDMEYGFVNMYNVHIPNDMGIKLSTIHSAKGLEYKVVFVVGIIEGLLPSIKSNIDEERKLFYVGLTRAKEVLYLSSVKDEEREEEPSVFLKELGYTLDRSCEVNMKKPKKKPLNIRLIAMILAIIMLISMLLPMLVSIIS